MKDAYSIREHGLARLTDRESLSDVLQSFGTLMQTGIAVYDIDGRLVGALSIEGDTPCTTARQAHPDRVPCNPVTLQVLSSADGPAPAFTTCPMGMAYASAVLTMEGEQLGRIVLGPFVPLDEPPPRGLADELLGTAGADAALARVRKLSRRRATVYLQSIQRILAAITFASYKVKITSQVHLESIRNAYVELEVVNRRLEKAVRAATEASRLKSAFLATVSHELKTPLTSILGYSEMLMDGTAGPLSPSQGEYARTIFDKGETLRRIIAGVIELARLESGAIVPLFKAGRLDAVAAPVIAAHRAAAEAKGIALTANIPGNLPDFEFDHEKMRSLIGCLVENGVKFTPPGGKVEVCAAMVDRHTKGETGRFGSEEDVHVRLTVADTGPGIPPGMRAQIFEPFYQVDSSDTREHGGMGIGLRLVKGYVDIHGGEIEVVSEPGKGSTFNIYLPVRHPEAQAAAESAVPATRL